MPSAVCPIPTAHSPQDALKAYLDAKKEMPGLTPAAWRKAAAQKMGLGYNEYLALWKVHKGAAKALKVTPASTPTVPAAASQTKLMGIQTSTGKAAYQVPKNKFDDALEKLNAIDSQASKGLLTFDEAHQYADDLLNGLKGVTPVGKQEILAKVNSIKAKYPKTAMAKSEAKVAWTPKYASTTDNIDDIMTQVKAGKMSADEATWIIEQLAVGKSAGVQKYAQTTLAKLTKPVAKKVEAPAPKPAWKPTNPTSASKTVAEVKDAYAKGIITYDEAFKHLKNIGIYADDGVKEVLSYVKVIGDDVLQTAHGPLTHDLAKSVYAKMKKDMPGGTPAAWRHAAADYLKVPYDDYLKAWKKPTTAAQKAATTPATKLPPTNDVPLSPSKTGKYTKTQPTMNDMKDELAAAYGPGANKAYIDVIYDDLYGSYTTNFPKSLITTPAAEAKVVKALQDTGLIVKKISGLKYEIKSPIAAKAAKGNVSQVKTTGTYTMPDGTKVLDRHAADNWTESWWPKLSQETKNAWSSYTASGYRDMNNWLRGRIRTISPAHRANIKKISSSMQYTRHEFTVFRGTPISPSQFKVGQLWSDNAFTSTAINPGSAWEGTRFVITLPKGTKGMYIGKRSASGDESEFLIDAYTNYRVTKVEGTTVHMTAIPKKPTK